ncbi:MAG TPA: VWA domain-containing protein [Roseiarcus sp.]|nr:VWA domain-containing protein [Roseiarcus sp.]
MSEFDPPPRAVRPFIDFVPLMRANGFAVAPEQTTAFLSAISLLGPRDLEDVRRAGLATLAPPPERHAAYRALFDMHFLGAEGDDLDEGEEEDVVRVQEDRRGMDEPASADESNESGEAATRAEALVERRFGPGGAGEALRRLSREASRRLPKRLSYRRWRARRGVVVDLRRTLRDAARNDGEVIKLSHLKRRMRLRRLLVLIDVSGSMKARTEDNLRLAHALTQAIPRVEAFTFGTRLTRVTRPMRLKRREQALAVAAHIVSDWDGGTRIGDALKAFLAVPRFASYARGAITLIISDGLERGDPAALADAVGRLSRGAWRLSWLTPLAIGRDFRPRTEALIAVSRFVDDMVDGGSTPAIVDHILALGRRRAT